jgi:uncharacterized protein (DUF983 family)
VPPSKNFFDLLSLCLRSRCPVCGKGRLFVPYWKVNQIRDFFLPPLACNQCQFQYRREPGYYFGVLTPTLSILAVMSGIVCAGIAYFLFQIEIPDVVLLSLLGLCGGVFVFFRTAIAVFIAFDHAIDPPSVR